MYILIIDADEKVDVTIELSTSQQPFGGERLWFICPINGKRVTKLYAVANGYEGYVSRHCYRIHYASQLGGYIDRAIHKKWKMLNKVDGTYFPRRPKGMHHKTFDKIYDEFVEQEILCEKMIGEKFGTMFF